MKANSSDVLVAGGGFSGLMAAIFAARMGCSVRVLSRGQGALPIGGGTVDVLGYTPGIHGALRAPFDGFAALDAIHPYRLAGNRTVSRALESFLDVCACHGASCGLDGTVTSPRNRYLLTSVGTCKPACLVPDSMSMNGLDNASELLVVGVEGLKDFFPRLTVKGLESLRALHGRRITPVTLPAPSSLLPSGVWEAGIRNRDLSTLDLARFLDTPAGQIWFADQIRCIPEYARIQRSGGMILVPPFLGSSASGEIWKKLVSILHVSVYELVSPPASITGLRLRGVLMAELNRLGVEIVMNASISGAEMSYGDKGTAVNALLTDGGARRWEASTVILATGGIYGEGILVRPDSVEDAIFGKDMALIPESHPSRKDWSEPEAYPSIHGRGHLFARMGARVNAAFQPLTRNGNVFASNLFAAGRAVGGYDPVAEKSGNGVALVTAFAAASSAAGFVRNHG